MLNEVFSEEELKTAVAEYVENWLCAIPEEGAEHVFSLLFEERKRRILSIAEGYKGRDSRRKTSRKVLCALLVCAICLGIVMITSPTVRTSVRNWMMTIHDTLFSSEDGQMQEQGKKNESGNTTSNNTEVGKPENIEGADCLNKHEVDYLYFDIPSINLYEVIDLPMYSVTLIDSEDAFEKHFPVPNKENTLLYEAYTRPILKYLDGGWFVSHQLLVIVLPGADGGDDFRRLIVRVEGDPERIVEIDQYYTNEKVRYLTTKFIYFVELDKVFKEGSRIDLIINNIKRSSE